MKREKTKTTNYIIRVNNDFHKAFVSLRDARNYVRGMNRAHIDIEMSVELVKQVIIDVVMNSYTTKPVNILTAANLGDQ